MQPPQQKLPVPAPGASLQAPPQSLESAKAAEESATGLAPGIADKIPQKRGPSFAPGVPEAGTGAILEGFGISVSKMPHADVSSAPISVPKAPMFTGYINGVFRLSASAPPTPLPIPALAADEGFTEQDDATSVTPPRSTASPAAASAQLPTSSVPSAVSPDGIGRSWRRASFDVGEGRPETVEGLWAHAEKESSRLERAVADASVKAGQLEDRAGEQDARAAACSEEAISPLRAGGAMKARLLRQKAAYLHDQAIILLNRAGTLRDSIEQREDELAEVRKNARLWARRRAGSAGSVGA